MKNLLGTYVGKARTDRGLTRGQLAKAMGYQNIQKGSRRIFQVERGQIPDALFLAKLIEALVLDREKVEAQILFMEDEAEAEFQSWLDEPVPMEIVIRYGPCIYISQDLPESILSEAAAIAYACATARDKNHEICLILNRRWSVWINRSGQVVNRSEATRKTTNVPYISIRGKGAKFTIKPG